MMGALTGFPACGPSVFQAVRSAVSHHFACFYELLPVCKNAVEDALWARHDHPSFFASPQPLN